MPTNQFIDLFSSNDLIKRGLKPFWWLAYCGIVYSRGIIPWVASSSLVLLCCSLSCKTEDKREEHRSQWQSSEWEPPRARMPFTWVHSKGAASWLCTEKEQYMKIYFKQLCWGFVLDASCSGNVWRSRSETSALLVSHTTKGSPTHTREHTHTLQFPVSSFRSKLQLINCLIITKV